MQAILYQTFTVKCYCVSSVNPITTKGADYALHITASPPGFENPAATLPCVCNSIFHWKNHKNTWPASDISKVELKIPKRHFKMN